MLQSSHLEDHMKTIGIDKSSFTMSYFEHICMNNIKNIYQHAGKCDDQQNIKDIIDDAIISTPEGVTYNSPDVPTKSTPAKKKSARKSLCLFTNILDVKPKTAKRRLWLKNQNAKPWRWGIAYEPIKKNEKSIKKSISRSNVICIHG